MTPEANAESIRPTGRTAEKSSGHARSRCQSLPLWALLFPAVLVSGAALAQVGPTKGNIVKPKPKPAEGGPVIRIRPIGPRGGNVTRPVAPAPQVVAPAPPVNPRLALARKWQAEELLATSSSIKAGRNLAPSRVDQLREPAEPPKPSTPETQFTYEQKVALRFVRDDGAPYDGRQVTVRGQGYAVNPGTTEVALSGAASRTGAPDIELALPTDWAFANATDTRLVLKESRGQEQRENLTPIPALRPVTPPAPALLFATAAERDAYRAGLGTPPRLAEKQGPFPSPARLTAQVLSSLAAVRRTLNGVTPVRPDASREARRTAWAALDRAVAQLEETQRLLLVAQRSVASPADTAEQRKLLGAAFRAHPAALKPVLSSAAVRRAQYLSEALWWRAYAENPVLPDRQPAIKALVEAQNAKVVTPALGAQLTRYMELASKEQSLASRIAAGEFEPKPTPRVKVTHTLARTVTVRRTVLDLRIANGDLRTGDTVTLVGNAGTPITFRQDGDAWRARVSRTLLKRGDRFRVYRRTPESELEGEATVDLLDAYNFSGNPVNRGPMRLLSLRSFAVASPPLQNVAVLEELDPADWDTAKLRDLRKRAGKEARSTPDGAWWVTTDQPGVSVRLRPSPYPEGAEAKREGRDFGKTVSSAFKKLTGKSDKNRGLADRVIVDTIRLENEGAGQVGGVKVGATDRQVEETLGGKVPATGVVRLLGGAVEVALSNGRVERIDMRRNLAEFVDQKSVQEAPGTVANIMYESNRMRVPLRPGFQPQPGMELEVAVAGRPLGTRGSDYYRALVLDRTATEVTVKLVRKSRSGKTEDAGWDVLRSLPPAESGAVVLRSPSVASR